MSNVLQNGAERLARSFVSPPDGKNCVAVKPWVVDVVAADPGINALVKYVVDDDCVCKDLKRLAEMAGRVPDSELCGRCATLKTWETGQ